MEKLLLQFLSALVGGLIVYIFGIRKLSIEIKNAFIQKQMSEFYSPIAGYRKRIRAKGEVREKITRLAGESWQEVCEPYSESGQPMLNHDELFEPYRKIIEYDNQQLRDELLPLYRKILDIFTDKYWLADEETRTYYQSFLEFVEIWERYLVDSLPTGVIHKVKHTEDSVLPFYEHVEHKLSFLQQELNSNSIWKLRL